MAIDPTRELRKWRINVLALARGYGLQSVGGECGVTAMAINDALFRGKGKFVAAANIDMLERYAVLAGHIGVLWRAEVWDSRGPWSFAAFTAMGEGEATLYELEPEEIEQYLPGHHPDAARAIMAEALEAHRLSRLKPP